ncbi:SEC-C metal-binding domain-containing protein [Roseibium sp. RKSG952]|uniref:SEC-C metal-binding domain-containing protein n=1 Tax=Roseibium sp. RKSG952 TaxID=2529384 RepID=UPI001FCB8EB9|nr:SEC-C metal-binding domain-containing protein [Roseibium sp. RKSG952]
MTHSYPAPLSELLTIGEPDHFGGDADQWPDYLELGFGKEHVPDLLSLVTDPSLNSAAPDTKEVWAPLHAWRTLGQLKAAETAEALLKYSTVQSDDDWLHEELRLVFSQFGTEGIDALTTHLGNRRINEIDRCTATHCLSTIGIRNPDIRNRCLEVLEKQLLEFLKNGNDLNGWIVSSLLDLKAVEAIETIRAAYNANAVNLRICGDLEDVEIEMGFRRERETPKPHYGFLADLFESLSSGNDPIVNRNRDVGRNDPCPCGSGKKYKKCCLE